MGPGDNIFTSNKTNATFQYYKNHVTYKARDDPLDDELMSRTVITKMSITERENQ